MDGKFGPTPLITALDEYSIKQAARMHMPGHKGGMGFSEQFARSLARYDITELPDLDNLHHPSGVIKESMEACARAFGAVYSLFLLNGSTSGIHAMLAASLKRGDRLLVARNCHLSVIHGLILFGIEPVFTPLRHDNTWSMPLPSDMVEWEKALDENPDVKGAFVTTPDYFGVCAPLRELAGLLHKSGKFLLVDEAHGAHFAFSDLLPATALQQGADLCVQSLHKTMPALTQAAILHAGTTSIEPERVRRAVLMLTTTSPSYAIMASMEFAVNAAKREGSEKYARLLAYIATMKGLLSQMRNLRLVPDKIREIERDPTRIVVDTSCSNADGYLVYQRLEREYGIVAEMADYSHVVFIVTLSDGIEQIQKLQNALIDLDKSLGSSWKETPVPVFSQKSHCILPELSSFLDDAPEIRLSQAEGKVSAAMVTPYPPGIPVLLPGEIITRAHIDYLNRLLEAGHDITGIKNTAGRNNGWIRIIKD